MRVTVSTVGRFHHFELAEQLNRRGLLERLYTGYPRHKVDTVPAGLVSAFPVVVPLQMALARLGLVRAAHRLSWVSHETLDRWVASTLPACDVLVCNHGNGLCSFKRAQRDGVLTVCDCGQPHVETVRAIVREEAERWHFKPPAYSARELAKRVGEYAVADLITVPSSSVFRSFVEKGIPAAKLAVVPYGVDLSLFHPEPHKRDGIFRVVYAGRISALKGIPYLLLALDGLSLPDFELVLIGPVHDELKSALAKRGDAFKHVDLVPRTDLRHYLSRGAVFVQPSVLEGLSLVMAQAMACGLPVIATTSTGAEDLFVDGVEGFVVPARDPEALRDRILRLYANESLRAQMAEAALERVRVIGGWQAYGERIVDVYGALRGAESCNNNGA